MIDIVDALNTSCSSFITRATWVLSAKEIHKVAYDERIKLNIHFDHVEIFGKKNGFTEIDWQKQYCLSSTRGYNRILDALLDAHCMSVKLNNGKAHKLDVLIPVLSISPHFNDKDAGIPHKRWTQNRPPVIAAQQRLLATQDNHLGAAMRRVGWEPSVEYLNAAL